MIWQEWYKSFLIYLLHNKGVDEGVETHHEYLKTIC